ncbi:MAG: protein kinase [Candidatus Aminicenantes bacterium]|jgi:serine/threonine protein kinase/predicted Zn-dependent protease
MTIQCPKCKSDNADESVFCASCGAQIKEYEEEHLPTKTMEAPREALTTGATFAGRYQIIEELGKGGMGRVYRAIDRKLNEEVALKLIKPEIASDKKTLERFSNELKHARKIVHKNIGRMYELMEDEGTHYISMEYVPGQDLKGLVRQSKQLTPGTTISIAKQICEGLAEAHKLGVVHRDLKPSNIMIDKNGDARIMDFGIARSLKEKGITGAGVLIGTPEYMSPEQVEGKDVDPRSDIYSLGVILYEMVTGRVPFEGDTALSVALKHKTEIPRDPREYNKQLSETLGSLILKCMEKDKEKRYQNAEDLIQTLTDTEKEMPTTERIIPKRKPLTSREITLQFSMKKLLKPALALLVILIVAVVIWRIFPQKSTIPVVYDKPTLAVMHFENNTGDDTLNQYRKGISDLLITDLYQSKHINMVRGDKLFDILKTLNLEEARTYSSADLKRVAAEGKATHILQGNYTKAGENFRLNYTLLDTNTDRVIGSERVEGTGEESIFIMVDELTKKIKADLRLSKQQIASDIDKDVSAITTSSPEALKLYTEARRHHMNNEYRKSIDVMNKAIAIDPEFAMAYRSLAVSYGNMYLFSERTKYIKKAIELAERLPDRERYNITGSFYQRSQTTQDKSIEAYTELLKLYPDDILALGNLGVIYAGINEYEKAIEYYKKEIQAGEVSSLPYTNLASAYRALQRYQEAQELLENYLANISDNEQVHRSLSLSYIQRGQLDLAMAEAEKAFSIDPKDYRNLRLKGDIYLYQGNFFKAEEEYQRMLEVREPAAAGYRLGRLTRLSFLQGKFTRALDLLQLGLDLSKQVRQNIWEAIFLNVMARGKSIVGDYESALNACNEAWDKAIEADYPGAQRSALYIKAQIYLEMGAIKEAQQTADELSIFIEGGIYKKIIRLFHNLQGRIELKKKNYAEAIGHFERAIALLHGGPLTHRADFIDPLAQAYYGSGDLENARKEYKKITRMTSGRLFYGDIYANSFYMLGKVHEEQGNTAKAIENYEKFLDLWRDADPGIAEVDDARERLAGLK